MENSTLNVIEHLSSTLGQRDEAPNIQLAERIVKSNDTNAVKQLFELLSGKKALQNDCIKVIYEIGERAPELINPYFQELINLLETKNNRLQWGVMTALNTICHLSPAEMHHSLPKILKTAEEGTVITRDNAINILISLARVNQQYYNDSFSLLMEQCQVAPGNQLPMYAEQIFPLVQESDKEAFRKVLEGRVDSIEKESKQKRIRKIIKKFS